MFDIITIGSATIDVFLKTRREIRLHGNHRDICYHLGDKVLIDNINISTGGGGTNTAVAFSRLGLKTGFLGVLGDDIHGKIIIEELKKEKVEFIGSIKKGESGYSVILPSHDDRTILTYKGVNDMLEIKDINFDKVKCKRLYVSTMMGKSFETVVKISDYARKKDINVALNISNYLAEKGLNKLSRLLKNSDILILNNEESLLLSKKNEVEDAIKEISKFVKGIVVVTNRHKTILAFDGKKFYKKEIKPLHPVNTTGAGDAFAAGFVYGILKGISIPKALTLGHREACSVLMHRGAKEGLLSRL